MDFLEGFKKSIEEIKEMVFEKYMPTTDNFCPNFEDDKVLCRIVFNTEEKFVYISVWGADDLFYSKTINNVENIEEMFKFKEQYFDNLVSPITIEYLKSLGFSEYC